MCYVDQFRFDDLERTHDVDLVLVPFELRPGMPEDGISAAEHGLAHSERVQAYLQRLAREGRFPLVIDDHLPNTHRAMALGELARDANESVHRAVHRQIFDARFGRGRDIGSPAVLEDIGRDAGIDVGVLREVWQSNRYDARLLAFRSFATELGVTGTPSALVCNELLLGSRPLKVIEEAVDRCLVAPESEPAATDDGGESVQTPRPSEPGAT